MKTWYLLLSLGVLTMACRKEKIGTSVLPRISREVVEGLTTAQYVYDQDRLIQMVFQRLLFDPVSQQEFISSDSFILTYQAGRVLEIRGHSDRWVFEYPDADLRIIRIRNSDNDTSTQVIFRDYLGNNLSTIQVTDSHIIDDTIIVETDPSYNVRVAYDPHGVLAEEAFRNLTGNMYSFFGVMEYDARKNVYAAWPAEIRLWRTWQKNPNNLLRKSMKDKIWAFDYEYNDWDLPVRSVRKVIDQGDTLTGAPTHYEYDSQ